jgi:hypothetical protein
VPSQALEEYFSITDTVNAYAQYLKNKFNIIEQSEVEYGKRIYGKGISINDLREAIKQLDNVDLIRENLINYMKWKIVQYESKLESFFKQIEYQNEKYQLANLTKEKLKEFTSSDVANKLIASNIRLAINLVEKI